jgi:hypothetical protein
MTILELQEEKKILETCIKDLIKDFEDRTSVSVTEIELMTIALSTEDNDHIEQLFHVNVEVGL